MKKHGFQLILISLFVMLGFYLIGFHFLNEHKIIFEQTKEETLYVNYKDAFKEPEIKAYELNTWFPFIKKEVPITIENKVNPEKLGTYSIVYRTHLGDQEFNYKQTVVVEDKVAPEIQLISDPNYYTPIGQSYKEEGFTCIDNYDGDLSSKVTSTIQQDKVIYEVQDSSGNQTKIERTIVYDDRKAPEIKLVGSNQIYWIQGIEWKDQYTAVDDVDGDLSSKVQVSGTVNSAVVGDYSLSYQVEDSHHNMATAKRVVHVVPANSSSQEDEKTIYLTFDDGPSPYTDELLAILAKYQVKATFFTTSVNRAYSSCMQREAAAGHTVAVHTFNHNYHAIYASSASYWADFDHQLSVIQQQTGKGSTLFRFPGGSSNTVSKKAKIGIMRQLAAEAQLKGLKYFDWNVSSGDAGNTTSTQVVLQNVITQVQANTRAHRPSVVLQHDTKDYSIKAVESIIQWGFQNGYHFLPLTMNSYCPHHNIAN